MACLLAELSGCAVLMLLRLDLLQAMHGSLRTCEVQLMPSSLYECLQAVIDRKRDLQAGPEECSSC